MPLTDAELGYIAGVIDGEGSIMLQRSSARASEAYIYPVIKVANTDKRMLDWLTLKIGRGAIAYRTRTHLGCKNVWHWTIASREAVELIQLVRPYLIIKTEQADTVLAVQAENDAAVALTGKLRFGHGNSVPAWLKHFRNACHLYVKDLNRRGIAGPLHGAAVIGLLRLMDAEEAKLCR